jgi:hypothetical protein
MSSRHTPEQVSRLERELQQDPGLVERVSVKGF